MAKKLPSSSGLRRRVKPRQELDSDSEHDEHFESNKGAPMSKRSLQDQEAEDDEEGSIGDVETEVCAFLWPSARGCSNAFTV